MKLTPEDAQNVLSHGKPYISNQRHYVRYGGVSYPAASLVWCVHTGQWPEKTPRHLDGNPANNDFSNLRPPGRAKPVKVRNSTPSLAQTPDDVQTMDTIAPAQTLSSQRHPDSLFA